MFCIFCLTSNMEQRWDKRDLPYLFCPACGFRGFLRNGLVGAARYTVVADEMRTKGAAISRSADRLMPTGIHDVKTRRQSDDVPQPVRSKNDGAH